MEQTIMESTTTMITSTLYTPLRPNSLNVCKEKRNLDTRNFIRDALHSWRTKARQGNVVPAERLHDLFQEFDFCPTEKQVNEMLQTAKQYVRRNFDYKSKNSNGLTFGEFCVLAADLKRFRTQSKCNNHDKSSSSSLANIIDKGLANEKNLINDLAILTNLNSNSHSSNDINDEVSRKNSDQNHPAVFLGGSCNPTTWRADVAIPALDESNISFYNPQVSDWTPDLIELEHRAKEKARVLFFVMDSETRGSAGAIEAAHIAGQNARHLVLVLHPYKSDQMILNEPISQQEYLDLSRNQQILRELVTYRGLPVLDNIPAGLQETKAILAGNSGREPPSKIASRLIAVRRAFDLVLENGYDKINLEQCQEALNHMGYSSNSGIISMDSLKRIIDSFRVDSGTLNNEELGSLKHPSSDTSLNKITRKCEPLTFDEFCVLTAFLSILQQEIHESGCISPIKGTNVPPPPVFLTNTPEWTLGRNNRVNGESSSVLSKLKTIFRTSSCKSVPDDRIHLENHRNRDSGTSSPQPNESKQLTAPHSSTRFIQTERQTTTTITLQVNNFEAENADDSDSNDSVFSSENSVDLNGIEGLSEREPEIKDIYLGGSCALRTRWRQEIAIPFLKKKGISFHMPMLHESIHPLSLGESSVHSKELKEHGGKSDGPEVAESGIDLNTLDRDMSGNSLDVPRTKALFNPILLDCSRVLLFVITNETRSLAPMTLAAHYIGLGFNVVLCVQMLPEICFIGEDRLTPAAVKDYNRGRSYLVDLAKRQGVPVYNDLTKALECAVEKVKATNSRNSI